MMTAAEFNAAGRALYDGKPGWHAKLGRELGYSRVQIWAYASDKAPIPRSVQLSILALLHWKTEEGRQGALARHLG